MGLCCNRRKNSDDENITVVEAFTTNGHHSDFQDLSDESLKNIFVKAAEEEDIDTLLKLVYIHISIKVKSDYFQWGWINNPETLGDLAGLEILRIIYTKLVPKEEDEAAVLTDTSPHGQNQDTNKNSLKIIDFTKIFEEFVALLKKIKFVQRSIKLLEADSKTLQDVCIWIFSYLSLNDYTLPLLTHKEIMQRFIHHINNYQYNPNFLEHIDSSLQILRNIYVKELSLRKTFVESGGFQLLYENILQGQQSTIREVLYNIEDLIYVYLINLDR
jgi:hypothetical protein